MLGPACFQRGIGFMRMDISGSMIIFIFIAVLQGTTVWGILKTGSDNKPVFIDPTEKDVHGIGESLTGLGLDQEEFGALKKVMAELDKEEARIHGQELGSNIDATMFGGDIAFTIEEACDFLAYLREIGENLEENANPGDQAKREKVDEICDFNNDRKKRKVLIFELISTTKRWEGGLIDYLFDDASFPVGSEKHAMILEAIAEWERWTCIKFRPAPQDSTKPRIKFTDNANQCYSYVGQANLFLYDENNTLLYDDDRNPMYRPQNVNLGDGCFTLLGQIMHELGHVLGFVHEHTRADRDDYVTINFHLINSTALANFEISTFLNSHDVPYDYYSVMHYSEGAFRKDGTNGKTIEANDVLHYGMGQRWSATFMDALAINRAYECTENTPDCTIECQNGGYPDYQNDCNTCICPDIFEGDTCETVAVGHRDCGSGNITIPDPDVENVYNEITRTTETCFQSPGYTGAAGGGVTDAKCSWIFKTEPGRRLRLRFHGYFSVASFYNGDFKACQHWVEIVAGSDHESRGYRFCETDDSSLPDFNGANHLMSANDEVRVHFNSMNKFNGNHNTKSQFMLCVVPI